MEYVVQATKVLTNLLLAEIIDSQRHGLETQAKRHIRDMA